MSRQQDAYLQARANGATMHSAAAETDIGISEARLIENEIARGQLALPEPEPVTTEGEDTMAKKAKPGDGENRVTNLSEAKDVIREAVAKIMNLRGQRKEINAAIGEQRARVKNYGVPPAALDLALRMKEADPEERQKHDEGYAIARDALGLGLQRSLFEMIEEPAAEPAPATTAASAPDALAA